MSKQILGGLAAAAMLAGGLAITMGPASATPTENVKICHATSSESNPYTSNNVNKSSVNEPNNVDLNGHGDHDGDIIPPFDNPSFPGKNWNAAGQAIWNNGCKPVTPPEEPPTPVWTPPTYPPFNPQECTEYRLEKATSTWNAETGTWSDWADWPDAGPLDWGEMPRAMTGHHGGTHEADGDRHFAYVPVARRAITTGECAPPPTPEDRIKVTYTDWVGEPECDETEYTRTRGVTTETYSFIDGEWVLTDTKNTRESEVVLVEEVEPCPTPPQPPAPQPPAPQPPAPQPPAPQPPASQSPAPQSAAPQSPTPQLPAGDVAALPPVQVPPSTAPAPAATTPAASLPATGSNATGVMALIALLITSLGGAAVLLSRQRNVAS